VHWGGRDEVRQALDAIEANAGAKSVVLISAKADGFIAGADINMLAAAKDEKELEEVCPHARVRAHATHRHQFPTATATKSRTFIMVPCP
jgi:3-hydroxyacyl-CoA dehydrogenase / enoyl-CoA hydratase / 3-hydroxybutyryl-CoA epimerase